MFIHLNISFKCILYYRNYNLNIENCSISSLLLYDNILIICMFLINLNSIDDVRFLKLNGIVYKVKYILYIIAMLKIIC